MEKYKESINKFLKKPIIYILLFCVFIQTLSYKLMPDYMMLSDSNTYSYLREYKTNIFKGEVNRTRTPCYPYLIRIIGGIFGETKLYENVVIFQKILFAISIIIFYDTMKKINRNKIITYVLTILFGTCPYLIIWNVFIMTEPISIFEIVLLSWITVKYLEKPNNFLAIMIRNNYTNNDYD